MASRSQSLNEWIALGAIGLEAAQVLFALCWVVPVVGWVIGIPLAFLIVLTAGTFWLVVLTIILAFVALGNIWQSLFASSNKKDPPAGVKYL